MDIVCWNIVFWFFKLIKDICFGLTSALLFIIGHIILIITVYMISVYSGYDWIWYYFKKIMGILCLYYGFIKPIFIIIQNKYKNK